MRGQREKPAETRTSEALMTYSEEIILPAAAAAAVVFEAAAPSLSADLMEHLPLNICPPSQD